jgi:hypothetical protein
MKKFVFAIEIVLAGAAIWFGVQLLDVPEIVTNASILCLSCIGIG